MVGPDKYSLALRIIAGLDKPNPHWSKFMSHELPCSNPGESIPDYGARLDNTVKEAACNWLAYKLEQHENV